MTPTRRWLLTGSALAFVVMTLWVWQHPLNGLDDAVVSHLDDRFGPRHRGGSGGRPQISPVLLVLFVLATALGPEVTLCVLGVVAVVVAFRRRSWAPLAYAACVVGIGSAVLLGVKIALDRVDPRGYVLPIDGSYPSGHTFTAFAAYGTLACLVVLEMRWWHWLLAALPGLLVGAVLLLTATHWLTDVVGGVLLAVVVLAGLGHVAEPWRRRGVGPRVAVVEGEPTPTVR